MTPTAHTATGPVDTILAALRVLYAPGQVVELRVPKGGKDGTISGFFNRGRDLANAAADLSGRYPGIYTTLNPLRAELLERSPNRLTFNADKGTLATDEDITERRWMLVDVDPVRPADASSTDDERAAAFTLAAEITDWLADQGWPLPVLADSGNGAHLLYRVELPNDEPSRALIHGVLKRLAQQFNTNALKVDTKVANASRICKVYGTVAAKGTPTDERPHRAAALLNVPGPVEPVSFAQLAEVQPVPEQRPQQPLTPAPTGDDGVRRYVLAALDGAIRTIRAAGPGTRNDTLNSEAYGVFRWAAGGFISQQMVWSGLEDAALSIGLDAAEVRSTLHSAADAAAKKPRTEAEMPELRRPVQRQAPARPAPAPAVDPDTGEIMDEPLAANDNAPMWSKPLDVFAEFPAPGVRLDMLPDAIANYAAECGELIGVDPSMVAIPALVSCAAALHDGVRIQPKRHETGWTESARLWCAIVGAPSVKKSPAIRRATKRLRKIDADLAEDNARKAAEHADQLEQFKEAKKEARKTGGGLGAAPERPPMHRMIVEDITIEALSDVLRYNSRGVLCIQDELSGWFGSMDAYTGGKSGNKDRAAWLQAYNGGFRQVDRVMRGAVHIPNFSVSMIGGIQPDAIRRIAKDMTDDGLMQRFMIVVGRNARELDRIEDAAIGRDFAGLVDHLHAVQPSDTAVRLSEPAHVVREALMAYAAELAEYPALPGGLRSHLGKWPGLFARLLLTYHAIECAGDNVHPADAQVTGATARRVDMLMRRFLLPHAMAYYSDILGASGELEHARWVAGFVLSRGLSEVTNRDLMQSYKQWRGMDDWRRQRVMQVLEDMGWCAPVLSEDRQTKRGATTWAVNPQVHTMFAEQAASEAERRTRLRDEIAAMQSNRRE